MSWKPQFQTDDTKQWYSNALRFETQKEAEHYAFDLELRWTAVRAYRAVQSDDPVGHTYIAGALKAVPHDNPTADNQQNQEGEKTEEQQPPSVGGDDDEPSAA